MYWLLLSFISVALYTVQIISKQLHINASISAIKKTLTLMLQNSSIMKRHLQIKGQASCRKCFMMEFE